MGYLGTAGGTYGMPAAYSGSLVDQFGNSVAGRALNFTVAGQPVVAANTDSSGTARTTQTITVPMGSGYTAQAGFAGDSLYNPANSSMSAFTVSAQPTGLRYTGPTSSLPNKKITLTAVLTGASGQPLAGRMVVFKLGSQTASATTDANGLASAPLTISQKNANYPLTVTFTPSGGDVGDYQASSTSATFKVG